MRREHHTIHESSNQVAEEPVATDAENASSDPMPDASSRDEQREDAAAGSEFVDDRIREE